MRADYPPVDRLLHRVALGSVATAEVFHDIERKLYLSKAPADLGGHVFVTGLARAGTTILLRELYATGQFGSLLYGDMPFVLAPNLWSRLSRGMRQPFAPVERAHGDGIHVNLESPEALDEVFWRIFRGRSYIRPDGLLPHKPGPRAIASYREFIRLVLLRSGKGRYLSKANNNILRLGALAGGMPDCTFLLVVRPPLAHAASLLRQHRRFLGDDDRFRRDYMRWLVHHEFGIDQRPYRFPDSPGGTAAEPLPDRDSLDYWLATWVACYRALEQAVDAHPNIGVVPYARLCAEPGVWRAVCQRIGIPATIRHEIADAPEAPAKAAAAGPLAAQAATLYARYLHRAAAWLPDEGQAQQFG